MSLRASAQTMRTFLAWCSGISRPKIVFWYFPISKRVLGKQANVPPELKSDSVTARLNSVLLKTFILFLFCVCLFRRGYRFDAHHHTFSPHKYKYYFQQIIRNFVKRCSTNDLRAKKDSESRPLPHRTVETLVDRKGKDVGERLGNSLSKESWPTASHAVLTIAQMHFLP